MDVEEPRVFSLRLVQERDWEGILARGRGCGTLTGGVRWDGTGEGGVKAESETRRGGREFRGINTGEW
jgi:hypothetical protein